MKWFVDGYNVIRRDADLRGRESESLEAGRTALLAAVAAAARRTGDQFTVVFDGARRDASPPVTGQVQIVFSRPPETADDVLRALVAKAGAGSVVASSDRAVCDAARRAGAVAVSAEDFVAALRGGAGRMRTRRMTAAIRRSAAVIRGGCRGTSGTRGGCSRDWGDGGARGDGDGRRCASVVVDEVKHPLSAPSAS